MDFDILENARQLAKDGKIDEAYNQIKDFKEKIELMFWSRILCFYILN